MKVRRFFNWMFFKLVWLGLFLFLLYKMSGTLSELNPIRLFKGQAASMELMRIHNALQSHKALNGNYPRDFGKFLDTNFTSNLKSVRVDSWGTEYSLERTRTGYVIHSAGPDRIHGSADDFLLIHRERKGSGGFSKRRGRSERIEAAFRFISRPLGDLRRHWPGLWALWTEQTARFDNPPERRFFAVTAG